MPAFEFFRRPPQWLRIVFASLLLAFALNSFAHVAHRHDPAALKDVSHALCGYCVNFSALAAGPAGFAPLASLDSTDELVACPAAVFLPLRRSTFTQPRAPPLS